VPFKTIQGFQHSSARDCAVQHCPIQHALVCSQHGILTACSACAMLEEDRSRCMVDARACDPFLADDKTPATTMHCAIIPHARPGSSAMPAVSSPSPPASCWALLRFGCARLRPRRSLQHQVPHPFSHQAPSQHVLSTVWDCSTRCHGKWTYQARPARWQASCAVAVHGSNPAAAHNTRSQTHPVTKHRASTS
jgi:hypothetical protein